MSIQCNVRQAKCKLSWLLNAVDAGEAVTIIRSGKAYRLVPAATLPPLREPGFLRGKLKVEDGWNSASLNAEIAHELGAG